MPMPRSRFATIAATVAVLSLLLAACGGTAASSADVSEAATPSSAAAEPTHSAAASEAGTAEERVRLTGSQFDPTELTIAVGTEVVFLNADGFAHTVTEGTGGQAVDDPIVDEEIEQNGSVRVAFDEPGTYDITCEIHSSMQMTITVED